jgi:DNA polymerase-3 subunit alpha/error-prone DNA polymerase
MLALGVRSNYSLMWGTASPGDLCRRAKELGYAGLALTDTDNLYGLWEFLRACGQYHLKPCVGAEVTDPASGQRVLCLVKTGRGFKNLCRLLSLRHTDSEFSLKNALPDLHTGLVVLTGSLDLLQNWQKKGVPVMACLPRRPSQQNHRLRQIAKENDIPLVPVAGSFFLEPGDYDLHRVQRAISLNTSLSRLEPGDMAPPDAWLASPQRFCQRFETLPRALENARTLGEQLDFTPNRDLIMPPWSDPLGRSAARALRQRAFDGAASRYGAPLPEKVKERLEYELGIIEQKHFSSYFLVVEDIVKRSPRICGRGSGAASLVAYSLGITNVCPIKYNLYFERFINPQREDPPDIDIDFAWDERDGVIESVLEQYKGSSAMVATHILFQGRMAIREVAKVYGLPADEIKRVIKGLPWLRGAAEECTGMYPKRPALPKGATPKLPDPWPEVLELAQGLVGMPRHLSVHVGGLVITPGSIQDYAPLEIAPKGMPVIQWEKEGAEEAGLVKIDLLGNRSLGVIRDAVANLKANGCVFCEAAWSPEDDPKTQQLVSRGKTMGCFYIESPATRLLQEKAAQGDYEHMVIHSSIIRPAANTYIQEYLKRVHGGEWEPIHSLLKNILDETYGIMVYQEQVSQAAVALAGFSHAQGDGLRKVMSKKDKKKALDDYWQRFLTGALKKGVSREKIDQVWRMMMSFAGYSFCKPHSASYARVSFQAAYLKCHFPAEFMAAVISNQGGFYSIGAYVSEARRLDLFILPPCVNQSRLRWTGQGDKVRVGLMSVKGLGQKTIARLITAREQRPFCGFDDFLKRVRPELDEARALIQAGAFETLHPGEEPARLLWQLARHGRIAPRQGRAESLFNKGPLEAPPLPRTPPLERLRREYAVLGFLLEKHPMEIFRPRLKGQSLLRTCEVRGHINQKVRVAAWLITGKTVSTSKHLPMQFLTFEDETGLLETVFFPEAYRRFHMIMDWNHPYILEGVVDENFGAVTLTVSDCKRLVSPA